MTTDIRTPMTPNFITVVVAGKEVQVSIADLADSDLREIGRRWTEQLLLSAKGKRDFAELADRSGRKLP